MKFSLKFNGPMPPLPKARPAIKYKGMAENPQRFARRASTARPTITRPSSRRSSENSCAPDITSQHTRLGCPKQPRRVCWLVMSGAHEFSLLLLELGLVIVGLAVLARLANRWGFSAIPLYLIAGLAFGNGGIGPLNLSENFIHIGAEIGILLLLFMLGLEYSATELKRNLRMALPAGALDFVANFVPGLLVGLALGWKLLPAVFLGGVTWVSSSGIVARVLGELKRMNNPETGMVLSI